jgi:hypothetical protein
MGAPSSAGECDLPGHHDASPTVRVEDHEPPTGWALGEAFFLVAGAAVSDLVRTVDRLRGTPVQRDELEPFS